MYHRIEKTNSRHRKHLRNVNQCKYIQIIKRKVYITVKFELEKTKTKKNKMKIYLLVQNKCRNEEIILIKRIKANNAIMHKAKYMQFILFQYKMI